MSDLVRFSVSLESELLEAFDRYCSEGKFATRSEAVRQLLHEKLTAAAWESDADDVTATLTMVYDHHRTHLAERLLDLQHEHPDLVVATLHVHIDHDHCLEAIVLRGQAGTIRQFSAALRGLKGIEQAHLVLARAESAHH